MVILHWFTGMTQTVDVTRPNINSLNVIAWGMNEPITSLAEKISTHPAAWLFWYMTIELEYDESTVRSAMLCDAELERHTVEMATWNSESLTVTTDMATVGGANYVDESKATMANYGEDIDIV